MSYSGKDRRIHRIFVTKNTEYHLRRDRCIAVRDRNTGSFYPEHRALYRTLAGAVRFHGAGSISAEQSTPKVGEAMCFDGLNVVTTVVEAIQRPEREIVVSYPRLLAEVRPITEH